MDGYSEKINLLIHRCHEQFFSLIRWEKMPDDEFGKIGIGTRQGVILKILLHNDGITQKELTQILQITSSSCGDLIGKLEQSSYLKRCASVKDKRTVNLYLTEKGRSLAVSYSEKSNIVIDEWMSDLSKDEQLKLFELLSKLNKGLEKRINKLSQEASN